VIVFTDSYSRACFHLSKAQITSDVCTEDEQNLKPRNKRFYTRVIFISNVINDHSLIVTEYLKIKLTV
jgi:hypothetical protein